MQSEHLTPKEPAELNAAYTLQTMAQRGHTGIQSIDKLAVIKRTPYSTPVAMSPYLKVLTNHRRIFTEINHLTEQCDKMKRKQKKTITLLQSISKQLTALQQQVQTGHSDTSGQIPIYNDKLKKRINQQGSTISKIQEKLLESNRMNSELITEQSKIRQTLTPTTERLTSLESQIRTYLSTPQNGTMIWKLPHFSQKRNDAQQNRITTYASNPFQTTPYGYKLSARIYPDGIADGKGTHLSVFIAIMKGEYDDLLAWPFTRQIKVSLLTSQSRIMLQQESEAIIDPVALKPLCEPATFSKPKNDINPPAGITQFIPFHLLESRFLEEDCLYLKVEIM